MIPELALFVLLWKHMTSLCLDLSTVVLENRYMQNNLVAEITVPSLIDCAVSCQSIHRCHSFGFNPGKHICQLHTENSSSASKDLVEKAKWIHGDIESFPLELWGPCKNHNCTGQKCSVNRVTGRFSCTKANLGLPLDHCPVLHVTNADGTGGQQVGSSRNYTCLEGYLDTASFLTSAVTTCLPNNTWSPLNLTCTGPFVRKAHASQDKIEVLMIEKKTLRNIIGNTSSLVFWVKTCHDSNFQLCEAENLADCYKVVIGGYSNTQNDIRPPSGEWVTVIERDILSCTEFRPFWISWQNRLISMGRGVTVGSQVSVETEMHQLSFIKSVWYSCHKRNEAVWYFLQQN